MVEDDTEKKQPSRRDKCLIKNILGIAKRSILATIQSHNSNHDAFDISLSSHITGLYVIRELSYSVLSVLTDK